VYQGASDATKGKNKTNMCSKGKIFGDAVGEKCLNRRGEKLRPEKEKKGLQRTQGGKLVFSEGQGVTTEKTRS